MLTRDLSTIPFFLVAFVLVQGPELCGRAWATASEPAGEIRIDPAPCFAAASAGDADAVVAACTPIIDNEKADKADRLRALLARAKAYDRKDQLDRAIADDSAALDLDPMQADVFNSRGELWRRKGDRPRAVADFAAAIRLNPQHAAARANTRELAHELERLGAEMAIKGRSTTPLK